MSIENAIVLVDPVSSGRCLKPLVKSICNAKLIGVFTLTEEAFKTSGKYVPYAEMVEYCDVVIDASGNDDVLEQIKATGFNILACIPASEPGVQLADELAKVLNLKGNDPKTSHMRRNKYYTRCAVRAAGLPGPNFAACKNRDELNDFIDSNGVPLVVKTPMGGGAQNVFVCKDRQAAFKALDQVLSSKDIFGHETTFALAEDFIPGKQFLIELFGDGEELHFVSAWDLTLNKGLFYDLELLSKISESTSMIKYCMEVGKAVGVHIGPLLVEARLTDKGPMLIEVGARLTGIDAPIMVARATTFNPFIETLKVYTDDTYTMPTIEYKEYARMVFCPTECSGVLTKYNGLDKIKSLPSCTSVKTYFKPGETIVPSYDLATIPMCAFLSHSDREQVERDLVEVRKLFSLEVK